MRGPDHESSSQHLSPEAIQALNAAFAAISGSNGAVSATPHPGSPDHDLVIHASTNGGSIEVIEKPSK